MFLSSTFLRTHDCKDLHWWRHFLLWLPFSVCISSLHMAFSACPLSSSSSKIPAICRLPLFVVSYPEENWHYQWQLTASEKAQQNSSQEEAPLKENIEPNVQLAVESGCSEYVRLCMIRENALFVLLPPMSEKFLKCRNSIVIYNFGISSVAQQYLYM